MNAMGLSTAHTALCMGSCPKVGTSVDWKPSGLFYGSAAKSAPFVGVKMEGAASISAVVSSARERLAFGSFLNMQTNAL